MIFDLALISCQILKQQSVLIELGAALTDLDEEGEKLADITLVTPQEEPHGQQVMFEYLISFNLSDDNPSIDYLA